MITVLIIVVAILIAAALAYLIVNKTNKGTRLIISLLLWVLIFFLGYKIYDGIMSPIKFNKEKVARYTPVIKNLKLIRDAELAYKEVTGDFTKNETNLITFIDTAKFAITEVKNEIKDVNVGSEFSPIMVTKEFRKVDTVGYKPVKDAFAGRDYKNMFKVPGTDTKFTVETGYVEKVQGVKAPVFMVKVAKKAILEGLDKNLLKQEIEAVSPEVTGEFISVGSLDDVKVNGNWPPLYDNKDKKDKDNE